MTFRQFDWVRFLKTLTSLAGKRALATMTAAIAVMVFVVWYIPGTATYRIELTQCRHALTMDIVQATGLRLGASDGWLLDVRSTTAATHIDYKLPDSKNKHPYPNELAAKLGCQWNNVISMNHAQLPDVLAGTLLAALAIALLVLSLMHRTTRILIRDTNWSNIGRIPVLAVFAVVALIGIQLAIAFLWPEFLADVGKKQGALLTTRGVLVVLLLAPVAEELWFRATALRIFNEQGFTNSGLFVTSISFALIHGLISDHWPVVVYYLLILAMLGAVLGHVWLKTRNWASCVLLHYFNNLPAMIVAINQL